MLQKHQSVRLVKAIERLPSLDPIVAEVLTLVSNPETPPRELSNVIAHDIGLSTRILKLSNSAMFGLPRQIGSLEQAIVLLGYNEIRNLVILAGTFQMSEAGDDLDLFRIIWKRLTRNAIASRLLCRSAMPIREADAFVAGLVSMVFDLPLQRMPSPSV